MQANSYLPIKQTNFTACSELENNVQKLNEIESQAIKSDLTSGNGSHGWSIFTIAFIIFVGDSSRGLLFPILWQICIELNGNALDLGYAVAFFSLGRLVVTIPLGIFCDKYRHYSALTISTIILILGGFLWANTILTGSKYFLFFAQFTLGCGSGSLGVTRSYVVEHLEPEFRTATLSTMTALQYAGFTISPVLGSILSSIGVFTGGKYWKYAMPAYFICFLGSLSLLALNFFFEELPSVVEVDSTTNNILLKDTEIVEREEKNKLIEEDSLSITKITESTTLPTPIPLEEMKIPSKQEKRNSFPSFCCSFSDIFLVMTITIFLNFTTKGSIAVYETLGAQIGSLDHGLSDLNMGLLVTISGIVGFIQLLLMKPFWTKYFSDIQLIQGGMMSMIIAQLIVLSNLHVPFWDFRSKSPSHTQFFICILLVYGFGYPIGHTAVLGAFSKIRKVGPQAALQGGFATVGSLARVILPLVAGVLYDETAEESMRSSGDQAFAFVLLCLSVSVLLLTVMRDKISNVIKSVSSISLKKLIVEGEGSGEDAVEGSTEDSVRVRVAWKVIEVGKRLTILSIIFLVSYSFL